MDVCLGAGSENWGMRRALAAILVFMAALPACPGAAFRYFDPSDSAAIPKTLSSTGFFPDMARKAALPEAVYFEINAPLWSDGAWKQRWLLLPPGKSIPYDDTTDFFAFPDSTVFVKNFWLEAREGDTASRVLWETRLLMRRGEGAEGGDWHGFSYRWNAAQDQAYLVPPGADFDTLFRYTDAQGRKTYKRWRYPSTSCNICHRFSSLADASGRKVAGRAVLGFYPAQLKRRPAEASGREQVQEFFSRGVFSGPAPDSAALERRFIGIHEAIPPGANPAERRRMLDTQARSYLAANCSGCHGYRGIAIGAIGEKRVNFDFYRFTPAIPFAHFPTQTFSLNDTTVFSPTQDPYGRAAFIDAVVMAGLDTGAGKPWNMALPPHAGDPRQSLTPALLYPGYPALSEMVYRQVRRATAALDSVKIFRYYAIAAAGGDTGAAEKLTWLFKQPWGSAPWEDTLANHGWSLDTVFTVTGQWADGLYHWYRAPEQMPELASYQPDTAALNLLAEWIRGYAEETALRPRAAGNPGAPRLVGRSLVLASGWSGPVLLWDLRGRKRILAASGPGVYRVPPSLRPGVYVFRIGSWASRIAIP
jgi:hypothetical protein